MLMRYGGIRGPYEYRGANGKMGVLYACYPADCTKGVSRLELEYTDNH